MEIKGKNILIFYPYAAPKHCGDAIVSELRRRGAKVSPYNERPSQSSFSKIIIRLFKKKIPQIFTRYIDKIINDNSIENFDYILVIRGEAFTEISIKKLRLAYPNAYLILYLWDILKTNNLKDVIKCFDKAYSFDNEDVSLCGNLIFRPTFFVPEYKNVNDAKNYKYDFLFTGTLHSNRYDILSNIKRNLEENGNTYYFYYYVPGFLVYIKEKIFKKRYASLQEVNFNPISVNDTIKLTSECRCILDISYSSQNSLSMRAFDALAAKKKYITTNPEIKKYDFYNANNIYVIDIDNPIISDSFINSPYIEIDNKIIDRYSVSSFIDDIFDTINIR